ncbi:recombinase family protein [Aquipuribacter hungaricus]|uniref:Recombinase family protein n=1 Tax=Aquipuribacter hungaricus TaxID=545624 RepID=A0ABV7WN44_9MICO
MATVGYARVSTDHQLLDQQGDALAAAGCERVFTDQMSGVREDRPGLTALLDNVRAGDVPADEWLSRARGDGSAPA